ELGDPPDEDALLARLRSDGAPSRVAFDLRRPRERAEDVVVALEPADHPGDPVDVHEPDVALGRPVELVDLRDAEALLEPLPDLGSQAGPEDRLEPVRALVRVRGRVVEVPA